MTSKSIASLPYDECCGCKACGDVCPLKAITFTLDEEGFFYPNVNDECIDCGLCSKVCPAKNELVTNGSKNQKFVGSLDKDKTRRDKGSSGGLFGLLASVLLLEGYEICGVAFDENLQLKHCFANSEDEVGKQKKSKYLQSDCGGIYKQIKQKVKDGKKVMFVGTPCQCAALKRFLGELDSSVVIVDFACHGVPSQDLFDKCIHYYEERHNCRVLSYSFRHKTRRYGSPQNYLLNIEKGNKTFAVEGKYYQEPFYCGFQKYITLRPSCYQCKFARTERVGDITLADFWGIEDATKKWDRTAHPSLVILNSEKGWELFEKVKPEIEFFETTKEKAVKQNGSLIAPTKKSPGRDLFFDDLRYFPFEEVVNKHLKVKRAWVKDLYYAIPFSIRKIMLNVLNKI